ncbi:MAG: helix-turn-helix domain-containing protein [Caulobacter sp.]|nr:helix-turn-helix domain-containing protein [Caulobacter sp.]
MNEQAYTIDRYVLDTLMADLVGHDRRPSAFMVYLAIVAAHSGGRASLSHAEMAERTGLSRRAVQGAVEVLDRRRLIEVSRQSATEAATYVPLTPWRRQRA